VPNKSLWKFEKILLYMGYMSDAKKLKFLEYYPSSLVGETYLQKVALCKKIFDRLYG